MNAIRFIKAKSATFVGPGKVKILNQRLCFASKLGTPLRLDLNAIEEIFCVGKVGMSDLAIQMLLNRDVNVAFISRCGTKVRGILSATGACRFKTRFQQVQANLNSKTRMELAATVVRKKIDSIKQETRYFQRQGKLRSARISSFDRLLGPIK